MNRQRVEDLIGEDRAHDAPRGRSSVERVRMADGADAGAERLDAPLVDLDRLVPNGVAEGRSIAREAVEDRDGERAAPRPVLADNKWHRLTQEMPQLVELAGERPAEYGMRLGGGQEIAAPPRTRRVTGVVTQPWFVKRALHESGKGDRAVRPDLVTQELDEPRLIADVERRSLVAPQRGLERRHDDRSASRTPGPTSV